MKSSIATRWFRSMAADCAQGIVEYLLILSLVVFTIAALFASLVRWLS